MIEISALSSALGGALGGMKAGKRSQFELGLLRGIGHGLSSRPTMHPTPFSAQLEAFRSFTPVTEPTVDELLESDALDEWDRAWEAATGELPSFSRLRPHVLRRDAY